MNMEESLKRRPRVCFEVEKIIGISSDGTYQVQWAPAWVSKYHLLGCEHLIQEFLHQQSVNEEDTEIQLEVPNLQCDVDERPSYHSEITSSKNNDYTTFPEENELLADNDNRHNICSTYMNSADGVGVSDYGNTENQCIEADDHDPVTISTNVKIEDEEETNDFSDPTSFLSEHSSALQWDARCNKGDAVAGGPKMLLQDIVADKLEDTESDQEVFLQPDLDLTIQADPDVACQTGGNVLFRENGSLSRQFVCSVCQQQFKRKTHLKIHLRSHTGERPYVCKVCGKGFKQGSHLKEHIRTHTGEKPYMCDFCGRSFARTGDLKKHVQSHKKLLKPSACAASGKI